ncbi:MAG: hypothetical protein MOGMAGMI_00607 [Candidatus Omnitrophica bacterium]|nr:hypothetical protein [Candidatus Omnitrophota bacterium]
MIQLTDNAKTEVRRLLQSQPSGAFLRLAVKGGGCSGMSYDVKFDTQAAEYDRSFEQDGIRVVCDSKSLVYLDGMHVDYSSDLVGGGFRFINPNASGTCGCGTSFTV